MIEYTNPDNILNIGYDEQDEDEEETIDVAEALEVDDCNSFDQDHEVEAAEVASEHTEQLKLVQHEEKVAS